MPTLAEHESASKAATERLRALDLSNDDGGLDREKLAACAELSGTTVEEKGASLQELIAQEADLKAAWDNAIRDELAYRAAQRRLEVVETGRLAVTDTESRIAHSNLRDAVREAIGSQDPTRDLVRASVNIGALGGMRALIASLFNVTNDTTPPMDNRFPLYETRVGRAALMLMMMTEVAVAEGQSGLYGADMVETGAASNRDGRSSSDQAVGSGGGTAAPQVFPIQEISVQSTIDRVRARDHTGIVDALVRIAQNQTLRQLWAQVLTGTGSGVNLHGGLTQVTNTAAIVASTKILSHLENEIDDLRKAGCEPTVIMGGTHERTVLRQSYMNLHIPWPAGPENRVEDVPFINTPNLTANSVLISDLSFALLGVRGDMTFDINPYTRAEHGQLLIDNYIEAATAWWQAKTGGLSPQHKKYTATNNFIAETAA